MTSGIHTYNSRVLNHFLTRLALSMICRDTFNRSTGSVCSVHL